LKRTIAIVVPDLSSGGGVPAVAMFLHQVLRQSDRYLPSVISIAVSSRDRASVRLRSLRSWTQGPQVIDGEWQGVPFQHVGSYFAEIEFVRYLPRAPLTDIVQQYDLIQVVSGTPMFGLSVASLSKPKCITVGTTILQDRRSALAAARGAGKMWKAAMTQVDVLLEHLVLPRVNHVFAQSEYTRRLLEPVVPKGRLSIGWPGVDTTVFHPGPNFGDKYILSVGRFSDPRKNVRMLLRAYRQLRQRLPSAPRLLLAGSAGPTRQDWVLARELQISEHVAFCQAPSRHELAALYRDAAIFALSSDEEGFGVVLAEAMASGVPVVCTRCGGPETIVSDGESGYLTPVGDPEALATAMRGLLTHPELRKRMAEAARRAAEARFSLAASSAAYLDVYDRLLS